MGGVGWVNSDGAAGAGSGGRRAGDQRLNGRRRKERERERERERDREIGREDKFQG